MMAASDMPAAGAAALSYAARGWAVFPAHSVVDGVCTCRDRRCSNAGKHPRTATGFKEATTDANVIRAWWQRWPDANVCIRTGNGLAVLDIDPDKGGDEALAELEATYGPLPVTVEAITGRRGRHLYMIIAGALANSASLIGPGIDVRADGGYVVAPPSMTAGGYAWDSARDPSDTPLAPAPEWLLKLATRRRARSSGESAPDSVIEGGRNAFLASHAGAMQRKGLSQEAIEAGLMVENAKRCRPPLDEVEVRKIAAGVQRYAPSDPAPTSDSWENGLLRDSNGRVKKSFGNACKILRHSPAYSLAYDEMRLTPRLNGHLLTSAGLGRMREAIESEWQLDFPHDSIRLAVSSVADERRIHPVRDYLNVLAWDGKPYLAAMATRVLGLRNPDPLTIAVLRRWAISCVARVMQPGCQVDTILVLVSDQGAKKTTFFRVLAGEWFGESKMNVMEKDGVMQLYSAWIYEWAEIDRITLGRHSSETKAFITQRTDSIRKPYAEGITQERRHTVIVGTTNHPEYLDDSTGARRYWTVEVPGRIDTDLLDEWRDQIWAEAVAAYRAGEQWWLTPEEETARVASSGTHMVGDSWASLIEAWIGTRPPRSAFSSSEIMKGALELKPADQTKAAQMRVGECMRVLGYQRGMLGSERKRVWMRSS